MRPLFYLKQLQLGPMQNFVYLLGDLESKECAVIDPGWEAETVLQTVESEGMKLGKILLTHGHPDHTNGVSPILKKVSCKVYGHKRDAQFFRWAWPTLEKLEDGDLISVGKMKIRAVHTPGHTPGSQCFLLDDDALFSGDTLFVNGCGRIDLPGGNPQEMQESLMKLKKLEDKIVLYPGHHYAEVPTSTLGEQKQNNPYLQFPQWTTSSER